MIAPTHDTLVRRLALILIKLNQGERLDPVALASEFGVNLRTIQRDLNVRFAYLPLERVDRFYRLDPAYLGKLSTRDLAQFSERAGVARLFPAISDHLLHELLDADFDSAVLVRGHHYEDLGTKGATFWPLKEAIVHCHRITFHYQRGAQTRVFADVAPYKLLNHNGIWYLVAKHFSAVKTFSLARIEQLQISDQAFTPDPKVEETLRNDDSIWLGAQTQRVVMQIASEVAGYFKRRKLIANQVIERELENGGILLSASVAHAHQILPIVRYWIPHVRIISPQALQEEMEQGLNRYLRHEASQ